MKKNFTLTLTIEGDSLDDIDNGLTEAAGQRLRARIEARAKSSEVGVPDGLKVKTEIKNKYNETVYESKPPRKDKKHGKKSIEKSVQQESSAPERKGAIDQEDRKEEPKSEIVAEAASSIETPKVTREDAVASLRMLAAKVSSKYNIDKVKESLKIFGVMRCQEVVTEDLPAAIAHFEALLK